MLFDEADIHYKHSGKKRCSHSSWQYSWAWEVLCASSLNVRHNLVGPWRESCSYLLIFGLISYKRSLPTGVVSRIDHQVTDW